MTRVLEVFDYDLTHGLHGRPLFRQCEAFDHRKALYPTLGVVSERCGGTAVKGVSWEGLEGKHTVLVCERHLAEFTKEA